MKKINKKIPLVITAFVLAILNTACSKPPEESLPKYHGHYLQRHNGQASPPTVTIHETNLLELRQYENGNGGNLKSRSYAELKQESQNSDQFSFVFTKNYGDGLKKGRQLELTTNSDDSSKLEIYIPDYKQTIYLEKATKEEEKRFNLINDELIKTLNHSYSNDLIEIQMVKIPTGDFKMGCNTTTPDHECRNEEKPVHKVSIPEFEIGKFEITFEQWDACVAKKGCKLYPFDKGWGRGKRPVFNITRDDIQQYIAWLNKKTGKNYRLPSEAEWEYVARSGSKTVFPWGNKLVFDNVKSLRGFGGWNDDKYNKIDPVGSYSSNAYGVYDMISNVDEHTQDCWNENYNGAPTDGSAWKQDNCKNYVTRGGNISSFPYSLRVSARDREWQHPDGLTGFRLARDID